MRIMSRNRKLSQGRDLQTPNGSFQGGKSKGQGALVSPEPIKADKHAEGNSRSK